MRTVLTCDFTNRSVVSGRSYSLANVGSKDLQFIDANIVALRQGVQSYPSELGFYKEPQLDHLRRIVFTVYDVIQNYPIAELFVELGDRKIRWIKPMTHYRVTPFELDLELIQHGPSHLTSIAV